MKTFSEADLVSIPVCLRISVEAGETVEGVVDRACGMLDNGNASLQAALAMVGRPPPRYAGGPPYVTLGDDLEVPVLLRNVDWALLRAQKGELFELTTWDRTPEATRDAALGIISLLDAVQDQAAEVLGEECVFGKLSD